MEPQLIDYYNTEPHMVKVIDNMNNELDDIQKKYTELELKYNKLYQIHNIYNIKIFFTSIEDREEKHKQMLDNLKNKCNEYISSQYVRNVSLYGLDLPGSRIFYILYEEFKKLSNNSDWSRYISHECCRSFKFFRGREMPHWNKIYNSLTMDDIKDIMYSHIETFIEDEIYCSYTFPGDDDY